MSNAVSALVPAVDGVSGEPARWGSFGHPRERRAFRAPITHQAAPLNRPRAGFAAVPAVVAGVVCVGALLRGRYLRWGATAGERRQALFGDELLPQVNQSTTRAITITTPADQVWPWIAQLGQGRGGFYSYDWLENLVAHIDIHNADQIVPEWQHIAVDSEVRLAPQLPLQVAALDVGQALVLRGNVPIGRSAPPYGFHLGVRIAAATRREHPARRTRTVCVHPLVGGPDRPTRRTRQLFHEPGNAPRHQDKGRTSRGRATRLRPATAANARVGRPESEPHRVELLPAA